MSRWMQHLEIEAAVFLMQTINKAAEDVEDMELKPVVKEIGDEIVKNLIILIMKTRETW
jgi:hypothetical protein